MKRRVLTALLAFALLWALAQAPASALAEGYALVVNTSRLNIRSGPGLGYAKVGSIDRGEWWELGASYPGWYAGKSMQNDTVGFVSANFLELAYGGGSVIGGIAVVNNPNPSSYLNLRQYASYSAPVLGVYYNGATCVILGQTDNWYYVEISGLRGYFRGEFLLISGTAVPIGTAVIHSPNGGSVNMRSKPSYQGAVIGRGAPGTAVTVYLKGKSFWFISLAGSYGFMDASFLSDSGSVGPEPPIVIPDTTNAIVTYTGKNLNLREQPTTSSHIIGSYPGNTSLWIEKQGAVWSKVTVRSSGQEGYMMTRYLTLYGMPATPTLRVTHPWGSYVNLRTKPSKASGAVTLRVPHGSIVTVNIPGGEWAQVKYKGTTGYMMTYFLK